MDNIMKITKGMKLTAEQKAQRKASRARNEQAWLERYEQRKIEDEKQHREEDRRHEEMMATLNAEIARKQAEVERKSNEKQSVYQLALKKQWAKHCPSGQVPADGTWETLIVKLALAHPETLTDWINQHVHYREAEGLDGIDLLNARIREANFPNRRRIVL
jgi:hypothetical protein